MRPPFAIGVLLVVSVGTAHVVAAHEEVHWMAPLVVEANHCRSGEVQGGLVWHQLQVTTDGATTLLQPTSGILRNGEVTGLLGPSGSGKTTFLSTLASRTSMQVQGYVERYTMMKNDTTPHQKDATIITLQDVPSKQVAWLQQKDDFFVQLTVQETLELAAFLELPQLSTQQRRQFVEQTCSQLGLQPAMHRPIGEAQSTSHTGGSLWKWPQWLRRSSKSRPSTGGRLSGGERRRLSVALELLTDKELIIADEPTSGLDSAYSVVVMKLLHDLAVTRNIPAICSLHQPRSSIWSRLDAVVLMAPGGRVCYTGPRVEVVPYFQSLGYVLPDQTNPAEFLIDLVSINPDDPVSAALDEARISHLASSFAKYQHEQWTAAHAYKKKNVTFVATSSGKALWMTRQLSHDTFVPSLRWLRRIGALWKRSWRQNVRDIPLNLVRLMISSGNALLLAGVFPTVRGPIPYINSIADRVALLSFGAINICMMAYMKSITLFAQERPVVHREHIREQYTVLEYLMAKVLAELPIDMIFSVVFATILKHVTGLQIQLQQLISVYSLLTTAGASLGYLLGSVAATSQYATTSGIPVLVILMVVGVINPSGVDPNASKPLLLRFLQYLSPFHFAIEALCLGEYSGVKFCTPKGTGFWSRIKSAPRMGGLALITNGDDVLAALGIKDHSFHSAMKQLGLLSVGNLILTWLGLVWKESKQRSGQSRGQSKPSIPPKIIETQGPGVSSSQGSAPLKVPNRIRL